MVNALKRSDTSLGSEKIGYAGRLDPMADGILLLLTGDENKKKSTYEQLPKTYTMQVLFGFSTDSYDSMGLINKEADPTHLTPEIVEYALQSVPTSFEQPYPPYSSKTIMGIPMYRLARSNKLNDKTIPVKTVTIVSRKFHSFELKTPADLIQNIRDRILMVSGDFRQCEIIGIWEKRLSTTTIQQFPLVTIEATVTSGTYMRSLANTLGAAVKIPAIAFTITRTAIGPYTVKEAQRFTL